jgi:hypothetical protein
MKHLPLLLLLTACPQDLSSANIVPGDGGVWVPNNDGGVTFVDPGDSPLDTEVLPDLPPMEVLCMLYPGDVLQKNDYKTDFGTWYGDVQDARFLGPAASNSKYTSPEGANLRYTYRHPTSPGDRVSISMSFEKLPLLKVEGAVEPNGIEVSFKDGARLSQGTAGGGFPFDDPYLLNRVTAQGLDDQPLCWDPFLRTSQEYHWLPCDWCKHLGRDYLLCASADSSSCFF